MFTKEINELKDHAMVMVLAAIQADGKKAEELNYEQMQVYIRAVVGDLKLAYDVLGKTV